MPEPSQSDEPIPDTERYLACAWLKTETDLEVNR